MMQRQSLGLLRILSAPSRRTNSLLTFRPFVYTQAHNHYSTTYRSSPENDLKLFSPDSPYAKFQKKEMFIGEIIDYVDKVAFLYKQAPPSMQRALSDGNQKKIETVMEYYCKKGKGDAIRKLIEDIPRSANIQAFHYLTQAYLNAKKIDKAREGLELMKSYKISGKTPYELIIQECGKAEMWDSVIEILRQMENDGYEVDHSTYFKIGNVHGN